MWHYLALLDRLDDLDLSEGTGNMYRLAAPSPIHVEHTFIGVAPTNLFTHALGAFPTPVSFLQWMDSPNSDPLISQSVASELGALMTFVADRRVHVSASEIRYHMEGTEFAHFLPSAINDPELNGPVVVDMKEHLTFVTSYLRGLSEEDAEAICAALELHYAATLLHDSDVNTATTLLVAGIEALATKFNDVSADWEHYSESVRFDKRFTELGLTDAQAAALREEILRGQHLRLQYRFVSYVTSRLPETFWDLQVTHYSPSLVMGADGQSEFTGYSSASTRPITNWVPRDPKLLKRRLEATYGARSRYVHAGAKSHDMNSALLSASGHDGDAGGQNQPLAFAGLRRILRELIYEEIGNRGSAQSLPNIQLRWAGEPSP